MSYLRPTSVFRFVEADCDEYVFHSTGDYIEDYGGMSNEAILDLLFREWNPKDKDLKLLKLHLLKRLAENLKIPLREHPLTPEEAFEATCKRHEQCEKENKDWLESLGFGNKGKEEGRN